MMILAARITVPALLMKSQPRSPVVRSTFFGIGAWYAGSSITKVAGSPAKALVFFRIIPDTITAATPTKYALVATHALPPKSVAAIKPTTGIFAPQGIKQVVIIVILRSLSCSMVRDAITPGTPQPEATSIGIKLLPDKPNLRNSLSMINATRDI